MTFFAAVSVIRAELEVHQQTAAFDDLAAFETEIPAAVKAAALAQNENATPPSSATRTATA
ncbi:MAG: hypothetical protein R2939_21875 [Kofleriaceae bacterium]